jgi:hypothetical protein
LSILLKVGKDPHMIKIHLKKMQLLVKIAQDTGCFSWKLFVTILGIVLDSCYTLKAAKCLLENSILKIKMFYFYTLAEFSGCTQS